MTQSVAFHFTSPQFTFEAGQVWFTKGARLGSDGEIGEIKNGTVDGVLVEGPIEVDVQLGALKVTRRNDRHQYEIGFLFVSRLMTHEDLLDGRVVVDLHLPLVLIFRVEDSNSRRIPDAHVGMITPKNEATSETTTNASGEIMLFGIPGRYHVGVGAIGDRWLGNDRVFVDLEVQPEESGERVVVLSVPQRPAGMV